MAEHQWFLKRDGKTFGPYNSAQFKQHATSGRIEPNDEVAQSSAGPWTQARKVKGLQFAAEPPPPPPARSAAIVQTEVMETPIQQRVVPAYVPVERGHAQGVPTINILPPRRGSSLGVASMILGVLAFFICWIPFVNLISVPLSALGLLLGIIGFFVAISRGGSSIGFPIAGSAICGLALFITLGMYGLFFVGAAGAASAANAAKQANANSATLPNATPKQTGASAAQGTSQPQDAPSDTKSNATANQSGPVGATGRPDSGVTTEQGKSIDEDKEIKPAPAPEPVTKQKKSGAAKQPTVQWTLATTPVKFANVQVQVMEATVGPIMLQDKTTKKSGKSKTSLAGINLEITNTSSVNKVNYQTWGGGTKLSRDVAILTDNLGNKYKIADLGLWDKPTGSVESESVNPGKSINDVLVFEEPIADIEYLNLELPTKQFGGKEPLRIQIPASMIRH